MMTQFGFEVPRNILILGPLYSPIAFNRYLNVCVSPEVVSICKKNTLCATLGEVSRLQGCFFPALSA